MKLPARYWSARFDAWPPAAPAQDGYTLLVPVPGDLPVFLELALTVLGLQHAEDRVETIVIPDKMTPAMREIVAQHRPGWQGALHLLDLPLPERHLLPLMKNPSRNHGVQLIAGIGASRGTHVVFHDADLFLIEPDALDAHWAAAREADLLACGISPVWDPWYAEKGLHHLTATWELVAQRDWLRSFPPHLHMGHTAEVLGQEHVFDTTLHAQAVSDPTRIRTHDRSDAIVHFNYVISTYRHFQRSSGPFADDRFRLLLIRLFVDLFSSRAVAELPTLPELASGLTDAEARVRYPGAEVGAADYATFRSQVERILTGPWTGQEQARAVAAALAPFDAHYGGDRA